LAAAYRLTALMGWTDMLGTHISCVCRALTTSS
jgi:hypothetical protein